MAALICEEKKYPILLRYASAPIQRTLINAHKAVYKRLRRQDLTNALLYNQKDFLTNEKFAVYSNKQLEFDKRYKDLGVDILGDCTFNFSTLIRVNIKGYTITRLFSEQIMQYGHYITKDFFGIVYDDSVNHLIDLMNASFFVMDSNPSLANAMIQTVFLLSRIYRNDIPIDVEPTLVERVKPYEL